MLVISGSVIGDACALGGAVCALAGEGSSERGCVEEHSGVVFQLVTLLSKGQPLKAKGSGGTAGHLETRDRTRLEKTGNIWHYAANTACRA